MNLTLLKNKINTTLNHRKMFSELFTPSFLVKNFLKLNYYKSSRNGHAPPILNIDLKVTRRCNANCYFCYSEVTKGKADELSTSQIIEFIDQFKNKKKAFFITGGEPFLRKDIFEIIKYIKNQGSYCGIVTNGTLLTEKSINKLLDSNIDNVMFSLHGLSSNDNIMVLKNSFNKIVRAITLLSRKRTTNKPYIIINSVINPSTFKEFKKSVKITDKAGADAIRFAHLSFLNKKELNKHIITSRKMFGEKIKTSQYIINKEHDKNKVLKLKSNLKNLKSRCQILVYPNLSDSEITDWYNRTFKTNRLCLYLYTSTYIDEIGNVLPCQFFPISFGNITKQNFSEIWNGQQYIKLRNIVRKNLLPGCSRCCKLF